jgi:hypothetical protein
MKARRAGSWLNNGPENTQQQVLGQQSVRRQSHFINVGNTRHFSETLCHQSCTARAHRFGKAVTNTAQQLTLAVHSGAAHLLVLTATVVTLHLLGYTRDATAV